MTGLAIINGVAIVVLVLVTGYYAWQTRTMAREMRSARLLSLLPKLVLDIKMIDPAFGVVVVRNVGAGPAIDADLTLTFEGSEVAKREDRSWLAHVIAPGEQHPFVPPKGVMTMDGFVAKHPAISLSGTIWDAFDQKHAVDERIEIAEAWARLKNALRHWAPTPEEKIAAELEKIRRKLGGSD